MEKNSRRSLKNSIKELEVGLLKLSNPTYDNIDKLMRNIMKKYDLTAKELHYGFRDSHQNKTPDEWIKEKRKMKTFREFCSNFTKTYEFLWESQGSRTYPTKQDAEKAFKQNPPFGGEPYKIKQKARKGNPPEWRAVRAEKRKQQEKKRRENLKGLTYQELLNFAKRNLYPNPEKFAREAQKVESAKKSSQTREAKKKTELTGVKHSVDHSVPQQDKRRPENRERFQRLSPGDVSSNRTVIPLSSNTQKGSKLPKKGEPGYGRTRSGAMRTAIHSARDNMKTFKEFCEDANIQEFYLNFLQ